MLHDTLAQSALRRPDERIKALRGTVSELLRMDEPRKRTAGIMSGLDLHYDLGTHLLGGRVPDLDLVTAMGPARAFTLLHDARPVLLNLGEPNDLDITPWVERVRAIVGASVIGVVPGPTALLIRPDGYSARVGDADQLGVRGALTTWFGPPSATWTPGVQHWDGMGGPQGPLRLIMTTRGNRALRR